MGRTSTITRWRAVPRPALPTLLALAGVGVFAYSHDRAGAAAASLLLGGGVILFSLLMAPRTRSIRLFRIGILSFEVFIILLDLGLLLHGTG